MITHGEAMVRNTESAAPSWIAESAHVDDRPSRALYTAPELMRLTGMSRKQISYWAKIGLVAPTLQDPMARAGKAALFYAAPEVVKALIVCELRRAGFTLNQVRQVARNVEQRGFRLDESIAYLLTDGYSVYFAVSDEEVIDILKHQRQRLLLVPIHDQVAKLREVA